MGNRNPSGITPTTMCGVSPIWMRCPRTAGSDENPDCQSSIADHGDRFGALSLVFLDQWSSTQWLDARELEAGGGHLGRVHRTDAAIARDHSRVDRAHGADVLDRFQASRASG